MFRKRVKKVYPEGTFIPTPARVCAILQLCLAFSAFLWVASEPFVGEIFAVKSQLLYYQDAMGIPSRSASSKESEERLHRNGERFAALPEATQGKLQKGYDTLQEMLQRSFFDKLARVYTLFSRRVSPYELGWIILAVAVSILALKKVEGAAEAAWLLPLLVAAYAVDLRLQGRAEALRGDERLFPSEAELVADYLGEPLDEDIFEQRKQLQSAWKKYLAVRWAEVNPAADPAGLDRQAEEGEYRLTLARIEARAEKTPPEKLFDTTASSPSPLLLLVYFFWNVYFAYTLWKYKSKSLMHQGV